MTLKYAYASIEKRPVGQVFGVLADPLTVFSSDVSSLLLAVVFGEGVMQVEAELTRLSLDEDALLAVGVFDGIHLGHKYLISQLLEESQREGLQGGVVTFHPHPREILSPGTEVLYLTTITEKVSLLRQAGVKTVITLSFTPEFAQLSANQFAGLLKKHLRMRGLVIGPDFALGRDREGNADALRTIGKYLDFSVTVVSPVKIFNEVVVKLNFKNTCRQYENDEQGDPEQRLFAVYNKIGQAIARSAIDVADLRLYPYRENRHQRRQEGPSLPKQ